MKPNLFVGVTMQTETDFVVGIRDYAASKPRAKRFQISGGLEQQDFTTLPADFRSLLDFLLASGEMIEHMRLCADFEGIVQPKASAFSKVSILLSRSGFGAIGMRADDLRMMLYRIPEKAKSNPLFRELWVLPVHSGRAWAEFTSGGAVNSEQAALGLAEIAGRRHLYYFLSSIGQVQSPSDILYVLKSIPPGQQCGVVSDDDSYILVKTETTSTHGLSDLSLEYATAAKAFAYLGENQAIKFALLEVCRLYGLELYCLTSRDGSKSGNRPITAQSFMEQLPEEYRVWPPCTVIPGDVAVEPHTSDAAGG
jgi:hypothetical protein